MDVQPGGAVAETNVVPGGNVSATETLSASDGPLLVKPREYVMLFPAMTGSGESVLVKARSALAFTVVVAVALLFAVIGIVGGRCGCGCIADDGSIRYAGADFHHDLERRCIAVCRRIL